MKAKKGINAAAWFYAQPGFHNSLSEVETRHEPICTGKPCFCGTTCPECRDKDGWHRNNCATGAERSRQEWLAQEAKNGRG